MAERLDLKLNNIDTGFELPEEEFLDFLNGFNLEEGNTLEVGKFQKSIKEHVDDVIKVKSTNLNKTFGIKKPRVSVKTSGVLKIML